ncbi:MAG: glycosyltransferase family 2 protein [Actinomycetota bacterium]|nr:glycosyltransferase family 2 protein [Actinomycetota bacterium]
MIDETEAAVLAGSRPLLSVVVPVRNEEDNLPVLHARLATVLGALGTYEVIFVDDGSTDRSAAAIMAIRESDASVKLLRLSRNFGHQAALSAGLDHARGTAVVLMDADLQDPPEVLAVFVARWRDGYEVVYAVRRHRKEGLLKRTAYFGFYRLLRLLSPIDVALDAGDFCLIDRRVADILCGLRERHRFLRGLRSWAGFRQVGVPYDRPARLAGTSAYSFSRLIRLALDGLLSFSSVPLRLASFLGFLTALAGVIYVAVAVSAKIFVGHPPSGWTSLIAIILVLGGVQLLVIGLLGEYLARVYDEVKDRPLYIVERTHGFPGFDR